MAGKRKLGRLAEAGFRVIIPDQRGYNLSDKPQGVPNYKMEILVQDILGLAAALGYERFHLAGHDFGAMVSWHLALRFPERLKRLVIANVPHPAVMRNFLRTRPAQLLKSWYIFFFQLPRLPEWVVSAHNWLFLSSALPDELTAAQHARYRAAWEQPGATTGMLNWYRAMLRGSQASTGSDSIQVPTLILWGQQDPHLSDL